MSVLLATTGPAPPQTSTTTTARTLSASSSVPATTTAVANASAVLSRAYPNAEYVPFDGFYHNLGHIDWGAADKPLFRRVPSAYADGVLQMPGADRPNPRTLSEVLMKGWVKSGPTGLPSVRNRSALVVWFGQHVVEEIVDAQGVHCPREYVNIPIPKGDALYDPDGSGTALIPFARARYDTSTGIAPGNPREQFNEITPWIDGGYTYGPERARSDALRTFSGGRMAEDQELLDRFNGSKQGSFPVLNNIGLPHVNPPPPRLHALQHSTRFHRLGNPRGNENPWLLTMGVLWFREHNYQAERLAALHPDWDDEILFFEARKWTIAMQQKVFWDPVPTVEEYGIGEIIMGMASQVGEREDNIIVEDLRQFVFGPLELSRRDLMAINIQRGRDHGLPDYNSARYYMGLEKKTDFNDITGDWDTHKSIAGNLSLLYGGDINNIDVWVGGLLETTAGNPGELFSAVLIDQFSRIRDGDRFWFENVISGPFTQDELDEIRDPQNSFRNILLRNNPDIPDANNGLQTDVWHAPPNETGYCVQPAQLAAPDLEPCTLPQTFDYYITSNWQIAGFIITLVIVQIIANLAVLLVVRYVQSKRASRLRKAPRRTSTRAVFPGIAMDLPDIVEFDDRELYVATSFDGLANKSSANPPRPDSIVAESGSPVLLDIDVNSGELLLKSHPEGLRILRSVPLADIEAILAGNISPQQAGGKLSRTKTVVDRIFSFNSGTLECLVKVADSYDIWVSFQREQALAEFVEKLSKNVNMSPIYATHDTIRKSAKTYQDRTQFVSQFLKSAISTIFNDTANTNQHSQENPGFRTDKLGYSTFQTPRPNRAKKDGGRLSAILNSWKALKTKKNSSGWMPLHDTDPQMDIEFGAPRASTEIMETILSRDDLAVNLGLPLSSPFLRAVFRNQDEPSTSTEAKASDKIPFRRLMWVLVTFAKGSNEEKIEMMFHMYDLDNSGTISREEVYSLLKSLASDTVSLKLDEEQLRETVESWFTAANKGPDDELLLSDFKELMSRHDKVLGKIGFDVAGKRVDRFSNLSVDKISIRKKTVTVRRDSMSEKWREYNILDDNIGVLPLEYTQTLTPVQKFRAAYAENRLQIAVLILFFALCLLFFVERFYIYATHREHRGLRTIASLGVATTRGAAQVQLFGYGVVLLTMCRNTITWLRSTQFGKILPLQYYREFHQIAAWTSLFFSIVHSVGHIINFYNISTQPADDILCYFRDIYHYSHELPSFYRYLYVTPTGISGVLLVVQLIFITTFSSKYVRKYSYKAFWFIHNLHPYFFLLTIIHGALQLVQHPLYWYWLLGPTVLYRLDSAWSARTRSWKFRLLHADTLPSHVLRLTFLKPDGFTFIPGQWMRIAVPEISPKEFHPFTISSGPSQPVLTLHINDTGGWTSKLHELCADRNDAIKQQEANGILNLAAGESRIALPDVTVEGPFDQVIAAWDKYRVAVFIGSGIGVTPFTSMLQEIRHLYETDPTRLRKLRKVYFYWITRSQRGYEWMTELLADMESSAVGKLLECHVFITEVPSQFDLSTTLLYITERQFHRTNNRSVFTGLQSETHFGRPDFGVIFRQIKEAHYAFGATRRDAAVAAEVPAEKIGIFTCGGTQICQAVNDAARVANLSPGPRLLSFSDLI
ncbi:Dual oxidase 1 [Entophlyctis luteolus]|nr:Dual oxidase 1 [Entophlyctis luteolus]